MGWRIGFLWFIAVGLTAGCGGVQLRTPTSPVRASQHLDKADALGRVGRYSDARAAYARVLAGRGAGADRALLGLARLALDPENPEKDERQAAVYLDRVLEEYPQSDWAADARTWRSVLRSVERLQREVRRHQHDVEHLRRDLHHEQQETGRLRRERERLRQIDLELERPVRIAPTQLP